jgi:hypothetical protein
MTGGRGFGILTASVAGSLKALVLCSLLALGACANTASSGDCEKLLDHIVDLEVAAAGAEGDTPEQSKDLDKQKKELKDAIKGDFMKQCTEQTPSSVVSCALKKKSLADLGECDLGS